MPFSRAPDAMAQPAMFGLAILATSSIAALAAGYAVHRVFYGNAWNWLAAVAGGLLWGALVFAIDRTMLNLDKSGPPWKVALQVILRLALGIAVGMSIAQPLFLRVSRSPIDMGIYTASRSEIASEADQNAQQQGLPAKAQNYNSAAEESRSAQQALDAGPGATPDYAAAVRARDGAQERYRAVLSRNGSNLVRAKQQLAALPEQRRAGSAVAAEIELLRAEIREAAQTLAQTDSDLKRADAAWREATTDRATRAKKDLDFTQNEVATATQAVESENTVSREQVNRLTQPDLATEFTRARQIMADNKNPSSAALRSLSRMLEALFMLLESIIVTIKMLAPESAMDRAVKAIESEEQEKLFLEANARIVRVQMAIEKASDLYALAIAQWHTQRLQELQAVPSSPTALSALREECDEMIEAAA